MVKEKQELMIYNENESKRAREEGREEREREMIVEHFSSFLCLYHSFFRYSLLSDSPVRRHRVLLLIVSRQETGNFVCNINRLVS